MHDSGRREGIQDGCLQAKEKTSRSVVSGTLIVEISPGTYRQGSSI